MKKRGVIFAAIVVGLLILGAFIGFGISKITTDGNKAENRELKIKSDKEVIHRNEMFNLSIENVPENANITWFLDDGNITFGKVCCYQYPFSDVYNISAHANWDGGHGNGTIEVYACNEDVHFEEHGDSLLSIRPRYYTYEFCGEMFFYSCNIKNPEISIDLQLNDVIGLIHIEAIFWKHVENGASGHSVIYDNQFGTNSVIHIQETFSDLEMEPWLFPYSIEVGIAVLEGRIGSYDLLMDAIYTPQI